MSCFSLMIEIPQPKLFFAKMPFGEWIKTEQDSLNLSFIILRWNAI